MYEPRVYRNFTSADDLVGFKVVNEESDLYILADSDLTSQSENLLAKYREQLIDYIKKYPEFQFTLSPYIIPSQISEVPEIVKMMVLETAKVDVGPMASVAGAVAEFIGNELLKLSKNVIIENGGDIFIKTTKPRKIGIHAGKSKLSDKFAIEILPEMTPLGICTSSATVGPSLSFGKTDATCVVAKSATFADACATAIGNIVKEKSDIQKAIDFAKSLKDKELLGVVIIIDDNIGIWGNLKIIEQ
ncbi:MAG: UPF0280 family protein [Elusimicrobia bacterium]|nr:UPF0280 family protein [Elusimicrobiota bacterium]